MGDKLRVAVLVGGRASEHTSAAAVVQHLDPTRFEASVVPVAPGDAVAAWGDADVVLPVLHGPYGTTGAIQGLLDMAGVRYVGSGLLGAAAAADREFTTKLLTADGLPAGKAVVLRAGTATLSDAAREHLGLPVVVAPASTWATAGTTTVTSWHELDAAIATARAHGPKVLVSAAAEGREIECGVLEFPDGSLQASAQAADDVAAQVQELAIAAFRAIDGRGLASVTCSLDHDGELGVAEITAMPELDPDAGFVRGWAAAGLDHPTLLSTLVETAAVR